MEALIRVRKKERQLLHCALQSMHGHHAVLLAMRQALVPECDNADVVAACA